MSTPIRQLVLLVMAIDLGWTGCAGCGMAPAKNPCLGMVCTAGWECMEGQCVLAVADGESPGNAHDREVVEADSERDVNPSDEDTGGEDGVVMSDDPESEPDSQTEPETEAEPEYPRLIDIPLTYTGRGAEFSVGGTGTECPHHALANDTLAYACFGAGRRLRMFDLKRHVGYDPATPGRWYYRPRAGPDRITWTETTGNDDGQALSVFHIFTRSRTIYESSNSIKTRPAFIDGRLFWLDNRWEPDQAPHEEPVKLYSLESDGKEKRWNRLVLNVGVYAGWDHFIAYQYSGQVVLLDLRDGSERLISTDTWEKRLLAFYGSRIVWDAETDPNHSGFGLCNGSIIGYDMTTQRQSVIVSGDGPNKTSDKQDPDLWEDWLVYVDFHSDSPCGDEPNANGDVVLMNLVTRESFPITEDRFIQRRPKIWGRWIVWIDRRNPNSEGYAAEDLYGWDLCRDERLKERFAAQCVRP